MHALIWCPPWVGQGGDLFFAFNAFNKHLLTQAATLRAEGWKVTVAFPSAYKMKLGDRLRHFDVVELDTVEAVAVVGGWRDPAFELYARPTSELTTSIAAWLKPKLPKSVDFVMLWETPVPFLRELYPDATIISQMPGAFSRAPYPQTTVFDPCGLYLNSTLSRGANAILSFQPKVALTQSLISETRRFFRSRPFKTSEALTGGTGSARLALLPLQISEHYAFKAETGFVSQVELCVSALNRVAPDTAIFITEYVSNLYKDQVVTPDFLAFLRAQKPNVSFDPKTASVPSVSQHLLQHVDEVVTSTSGLCFQAMVWGLPVKVVGNTHLSPFDERYVDNNEKRERALSFILSRQQPLSKLIMSDGKFLTRLLQEIHSRRSQGVLDRMPDFNSLDGQYSEKVMASFRPQEVERSFVNVGFAAKPPGKVAELEALIANVRPKLISFDLFDTLVTRGFEQPADLYLLLESNLRAAGLDVPFDFAAKRLSAEILARRKSSKEEITLDSIYQELALAEGLSLERMVMFRDREIELEIQSCHVRPLGRQLYIAAQQRKMAICVTSDMYLPRETIDSILSKNGYDGVQAVYLSSEIGLTKKSGSLFNYLAKQHEIATRDIIHIGDNAKTDVKSAKLAGVVPFHVPRAVERLWRHEVFSGCFPARTPISSLGRSVTAAAISRTLLDDLQHSDESISEGEPWRLGYAAVGPLVYGFIAWLRKAALADNVETLHFLSREGKIFKDVFDRMEQASPTGIRSNYLWGSRRAIRVAQMQSLGDILELGKQTIDQSATVESVLRNRFALDTSKVATSMLRSAGYKSLADEVSNTLDGKAKLSGLLTLLKDDILAVSAAEGAVYTDYLKSQGLFGDKKFAVVDVGWNANMQGSLGQLLKKPITGYYFATLFGAERWSVMGHQIRAYHREACTVTTNDVVLSNRIILETILCDVTPTIRGVFRAANESFVPIYADAVTSSRLQLVGSLHDGARAFVDDVCRVLGGQVGSVNVGPDVALSVMEAFLASPNAIDARLFEGHELEDSFSGAQARYLLSPFKQGRPTHSSYWVSGEMALKGDGSPQGLPSYRASKNKLSVRERLLMPFVRPFVRRLGDERDVIDFNANPSAFFGKLRERRYRRIGAILFPRR